MNNFYILQTLIFKGLCLRYRNVSNFSLETAWSKDFIQAINRVHKLRERDVPFRAFIESTHRQREMYL